MSEQSLVDINLDNAGESEITPEITPESQSNTRPEGIPDDFWDSEKNTINHDKLLEGYKSEAKQKADLRAIISKGVGKPPKSVEEYDLQFDESLKDSVKSDDPTIAIAKQAALEAGMPKEAFNKFVNKYLSGLQESNLFQPQQQYTPEELETLQKIEDDKFRKEQMDLLGEDGQQYIRMLNEEMTGLYNKGSLTEEDIQAFKEAAYDAKGVRFIAKLVQRYKGQKYIPTKNVIESGILTKEELDAMAGSDDPAIRRKRTEGYKRLEKLGML